MTSEECYYLVLEELSKLNDVEIISRSFDEENFGNFFVAYSRGALERSILADRGELVSCKDMFGEQGCKTMLPSIAEKSYQEVGELVRGFLASDFDEAGA